MEVLLAVSTLLTLLGGAGGQRILTDIARAMPPVSSNANYFVRWAWLAVQYITGHDIPNNPTEIEKGSKGNAVVETSKRPK